MPFVKNWASAFPPTPTRRYWMPIVHVILMLILWALFGIFLGGVPWLYAVGLFVVTLLVIIAVYRRV